MMTPQRPREVAPVTPYRIYRRKVDGARSGAWAGRIKEDAACTRTQTCRGRSRSSSLAAGLRAPCRADARAAGCRRCLARRWATASAGRRNLAARDPAGARSAGVRAAVAAEGHLPSIGNWSAWGSAEPLGQRLPVQSFRPWLASRPSPVRCAAARGGAIGRGAGCRGHGGRRIRAAGGRRLADRSRRRQSKSRRGSCSMPAGAVPALRGNAASGVARWTGWWRWSAHGGAALRMRTMSRPPPWWRLRRIRWWYSAPLPQDRLAAPPPPPMFMTDADVARAAGASTQAWLDRLAAAQHTAERALRCGAGLAGPLSIMPAASSRLERFGDVDWLAIGDAARTQDPLSSEANPGGDGKRHRWSHRGCAGLARRSRRHHGSDRAARDPLARLSRSTQSPLRDGAALAGRAILAAARRPLTGGSSR